MKVRKNKIKINALKIAHSGDDISYLLYKLGSYSKVAQYIRFLENEGYYDIIDSKCILTEKGIKFLQKVAPRFTL